MWGAAAGESSGHQLASSGVGSQSIDESRQGTDLHLRVDSCVSHLVSCERRGDESDGRLQFPLAKRPAVSPRPTGGVTQRALRPSAFLDHQCCTSRRHQQTRQDVKAAHRHVQAGLAAAAAAARAPFLQIRHGRADPPRADYRDEHPIAVEQTPTRGGRRTIIIGRRKCRLKHSLGAT